MNIKITNPVMTVKKKGKGRIHGNGCGKALLLSRWLPSRRAQSRVAMATGLRTPSDNGVSGPYDSAAHTILLVYIYMVYGICVCIYINIYTI